MADPAESPKEPFNPPAREVPSKDELEKGLADHKIDDLKEMAKRLVKSHESMNEMFEDFQAEKKGLEEENAELQQTIDRFMKELQKLNIGADNTVAPQLAEGPLIFANRMWEQLKPRDTGVVVSEHVGEIKKPVPEDENSPQHAEKVRQVVENVAENVAGAMGPLWQRGLGAWSNLQQKFAEGREAPAAKKQPRKKIELKAAGQRASQGSASASTSEPAATIDFGSQLAAPPPVAAPPAEAPAPAAAPPAEAAAAPAEVEKPAASSPTTPAAEKTPTKDVPPADVEEEVSSTILIVAELTLDDGTVQTLQVRAADRCKEVAKNFIQEHSLKAWFTDPLTKWLKQIEADAETFPVKVSGDLMEIRQQHSKK